MKCRFCCADIEDVFVDLHNAPPSNDYLTEHQLNEPEIYFPLKIHVCKHCWLVQVEEYKKSDELFSRDYAYFSSTSKSWLQHSERYVDMISEKLRLSENSQVVEIASNDGYLLQFFKRNNIPCLGIEPTESTATVSINKGIETIQEFFGYELAKNLVKNRRKSDLILGNNVLAHVPDINDFVKGLAALLSEQGTITMEFPHLMNLIEFNQFDTIYHEHFSYLSLYTVVEVFKAHNLDIYDVEQLETHGGSLRIYAKHCNDDSKEISEKVLQVLLLEEVKGLKNVQTYLSFQKKTDKVRDDFTTFLIEQYGKGKKIAAYGAAAKGNTLLNYCGIKDNLIEFVSDAAPSKQGKYLPGSHIPIYSEQRIKDVRPDFIIVLPWNLKTEITEQLRYVREWNGKFVIAIPSLEVF